MSIQELVTSWSSYPNIYHIGHPAVAEFVLQPVLVEEKADGCFSSDTFVMLANGKQERISSMVNGHSNAEVLSYNFDNNRIEPKRIINWFKYDATDPTEFIEIQTRGRTTGRQTKLRLTKNHKIYTDNGYKLAGEIQVGDILYRPNYKIDYIQRQLILGSLLGDASLSRNKLDNPRYNCGHINTEYVTLLTRILANLGTRNDTRISGHGSEILRVHTHSLPELVEIWNTVYGSEKKSLHVDWINDIGPIALAFWYMDNGSFTGNQVHFSTNGFDKSENHLLQSVLHKFGIESVARKTRTYYELVITQKHTDELFYLIAQYIPAYMQYKLPDKFKFLRTFWDNYIYTPDGMCLLPAKVLKITSYIPLSKKKYDIEVEDNHNYFANRTLVSNSQLSFGRFNGELKLRSKNNILYPDNPEKMFESAVEAVKLLDLHDGWTYRSEFLARPKHNALAYNRIPEKHIIIFDINPSYESYLSYDEKAAEAKRIGLEVVPRLYEGIVTQEILISLLQHESILGGTTIEGVVLKNYGYFGRDKKVLMAKFVSEAFKEKHDSEWKKANPRAADIVETIGAALCTHARWQKSIQHLRDAGELENDPRDIGKLLKAIGDDVYKEEKEAITEKLFKWAWPRICRRITRGFPEQYKLWLTESALSQNEDDL